MPPSRGIERSSRLDVYLHAASAQHACHHAVMGPAEFEVSLTAGDGETAQLDTGDGRGQHRAHDTQAAAETVGDDAKSGLQHVEHGSGGPSLRMTGDRI